MNVAQLASDLHELINKFRSERDEARKQLADAVLHEERLRANVLKLAATCREEAKATWGHCPWEDCDQPGRSMESCIHEAYAEELERLVKVSEEPCTSVPT